MHLALIKRQTEKNCSDFGALKESSRRKRLRKFTTKLKSFKNTSKCKGVSPFVKLQAAGLQRDYKKNVFFKKIDKACAEQLHYITGFSRLSGYDQTQR